VHVAVAVCVTVNVLPAIAIVPVRLAPELLVATMKVAVPFPCPGPALRTAIQATLLIAVHAHAGGAVTVLLPEPPSDVKARDVGEIEVVQPAGAVCVTVNDVPAIVRVPVRLVVPVFAPTLNATVPDPDADAPLVTVIQAALLLADHAQPAAAVTALLPAPPSPASVTLAGEML
jgi:hypothetical protein